MPEYHPGQVWTYKNRKGEEASRVIICKVEPLSGEEEVVHIQVTGVRVETPYGMQNKVTHLPMYRSAVNESVLELESNSEDIPDCQEGYDSWKKAYEKGGAGIFTISIADCVDLLEEAMNKGEPVEYEEQTETKNDQP